MEIKRTKDYSIFKKMEGNREVSQVRINKIIKSIRKVGYIISPILVNENMEIIDGQGRFEALKQLHIPIDYITQSGIGIEECIAMNIYQTKWSNRDYIESYANRGIEGYILLKKLMNEYPMVSLDVLATATSKLGKFSSYTISNGTLILTDKIYELAKERLDYAVKFLPYITSVIGSVQFLLQSLIFAYDMEGVDRERLFGKVSTYAKLMTPYTNLNECMQSIEEIYNKNAKKYIYIYTQFRMLMKENLKVASRSQKQKYKARLQALEDERKEIVSNEQTIENAEELKELLEEINENANQY